MPSPQSVVLADTMAIKVAHDLGCWNALRRAYRLHSVVKCVEEATRANRDGVRLVKRTAPELAGELVLGQVDQLMVTRLMLQVGHQTDLHEGEQHLLAYALSLRDVWFLCGPDNGTVRAMQTLSVFDRMVSLEALAQSAGHQFRSLPHHYSERWLADHRTKYLLEGSPSPPARSVKKSP